MRRFSLAVILLLVANAMAFAWSEAGHKITASIAFRQLTPDEQAKIVAILKNHPRWKEDFESKVPEDLTTDNEKNEWIFQQAAVWPDMARGFKGDDRKFNHPSWHYIDIPVFLTPDDKSLEGKLKFNQSLTPPAEAKEDMNCVQVLRFARAALADKQTPDDVKAVLLCWVFHLTGDIHQPLHSSALVSKALFPSGDRGGNSIKTDQRQNLHSLWDQFLGNKAAFRTARNRAIALVNDADQAKIGVAAAKQLDESLWMNESHALAESTAYDSELTGYLPGYQDKSEAPPIQLTERYLKVGGAVAEKRVTEAGYRLGEVLKQAVSH